jgi:hypothetical protein
LSVMSVTHSSNEKRQALYLPSMQLSQWCAI